MATFKDRNIRRPPEAEAEVYLMRDLKTAGGGSGVTGPVLPPSRRGGSAIRTPRSTRRGTA